MWIWATQMEGSNYLYNNVISWLFMWHEETLGLRSADSKHWGAV